MRTIKDTILSVRVKSTLKEKLKELSHANDKSLSDYISHVLDKHIKDKEAKK